MTARRKLNALLAVSVLLAALLVPTPAHAENRDIELQVSIPHAGALEVTDAQFRWGVNVEMGSGAFFGGCNFLSAGVAGDAGSSRVWTEADGLYRSTAGNSRIEAPDAKGEWVTDSWDAKCRDGSGREVGTDFQETGTGAQAVIEKGTGTVDLEKGTASISWDGSFSLVMYGGLTYWTLSDPVLTVSNGRGTLTATASGYGADMNDSSQWQKLSESTITMADLPQVQLGEKGIITTPAYQGVTVDGLETEQVRSENWWGAFPNSWVEYNRKTGQSGYWYSTGGIRDAAKVASDVYISYTPQNPVLGQPQQAPPPITSETNEITQNPNGNSLGQDGLPSPASTVLQQAAGALTAPLAELIGSGTSILEAATVAGSAINWLGTSLIPEAIERAKDYRQALLWSLAGLLAMASVAWVGFRRGWLIWPFSAKQRDQNTDS